VRRGLHRAGDPAADHRLVDAQVAASLERLIDNTFSTSSSFFAIVALMKSRSSQQPILPAEFPLSRSTYSVRLLCTRRRPRFLKLTRAARAPQLGRWQNPHLQAADRWL